MRSSNAGCCSFWGPVFVLALISACHGDVSFGIFKADGITPFDGRAIMVGTQLQIIVSSDAPMYFSGGFFMKEAERFKADLVPGVTFPAAGRNPLLDYWEDEFYEGCVLGVGSSPKVGDWFSMDYIATEAGDCNVGIYEEDGMGGFALIGSEYQFSHVKTRDFSGDGQVDFADFAKFAAYWQMSVCIDECPSYDLDDNGVIDNVDVALFSDYWLERTF